MSINDYSSQPYNQDTNPFTINTALDYLSHLQAASLGNMYFSKDVEQTKQKQNKDKLKLLLTEI